MVNEETLRGSWQEIRGKIRSKWGQLSDDELQQYSGNLEELVGTIQRKTGESQEAIRDYLEELTERGVVSGRWAEQASRYVSQAGASVQDASQQVAGSLASAYSQAGEFVQRRPTQSLLTAFGIGVVTGLIVALSMRSR